MILSRLKSNNKSTVKILSFDGGGMRGYLSATFMKQFCSDAGITPTEIFNSFDIITGTSIGGIQGLAYAFGQSPDTMLQFFADQGPNIFYYDSVLPLPAYKFSVIMGLPTYPSTFYGQDPLRAALQSVFGTSLLSDLQTNVIIPSWDATNDESLIFSNITGFDPFLNNPSIDIVTAGLATSAAPLYFPPVSYTDPTQNALTLIDGGVYVNNPVTVAYSVSKKMFPNASRFCVLDVGTGLKHTSFTPETMMRKSALSQLHPPLLKEVKQQLQQMRQKLLKSYPDRSEQVNFLTSSVNSIAPYNVDYLFYLMESVFIPGPQELNAEVMEFESTDLFDDIYFYRFQYQFQEGQDASLDNYSPDQLAALSSYATQQYAQDELLIQNFIEHFNASST